MQLIQLITRNQQKCLLLILSATLMGCASYPCGEPNMGRCSSVSENYQRSFTDYRNPDDLPNGSNAGNSDSDDKPVKVFNFTQYSQIPVDGSPLVSQPTMMRVWLTPYTDSDYVYHGQGYEYILTDKGHWLYGNNLKVNDRINDNIRNISLAQGINAKPAPDGGFGIPVSPVANSSKATNPNTMLSDYPAFNALKTQSVPINRTTTGTTTIYAQ